MCVSTISQAVLADAVQREQDVYRLVYKMFRGKLKFMIRSMSELYEEMWLV